jgi:hypothetical protein
MPIWPEERANVCAEGIDKRVDIQKREAALAALNR